MTLTALCGSMVSAVERNTLFVRHVATCCILCQGPLLQHVADCSCVQEVDMKTATHLKVCCQGAQLALLFQQSRLHILSKVLQLFQGRHYIVRTILRGQPRICLHTKHQGVDLSCPCLIISRAWHACIRIRLQQRRSCVPCFRQ